jgi:hypothetical protein
MKKLKVNVAERKIRPVRSSESTMTRRAIHFKAVEIGNPNAIPEVRIPLPS